MAALPDELPEAFAHQFTPFFATKLIAVAVREEVAGRGFVHLDLVNGEGRKTLVQS